MTDKDVTLARMRRGIAWLKMLQFDIEEAESLLRDDRITPIGAVVMLRDAGVAEICCIPEVDADTGFRTLDEGDA